jgi:DNA primase
LEQKPKVTKKNLKLNPLPANFKLFFFDDSTKIAETKALKYLYARGFDDETIKNNFLGYVGIDGSKYENSIIIPFFNEKYEIAYFISRKFNKSSSIRYVNLETADGFYSRNDVIFNQFGFDTAETLILCEGAFNAMTYNMILQDTKVQAVATNGTKVSGAIIDRILHRAGLHRIIFAFDYKTDAVVRDIYSRLLGKCEFEIILFEDIKDVNDLLILGGGGAVKKKFESRKKYQPNYFI